MGHISGETRFQATLFPVMPDELVAPDAVVGVIDARVETPDMSALGFAKTQAHLAGRPPYDPADLLKLYLRGYPYGMPSIGPRQLARYRSRKATASIVAQQTDVSPTFIKNLLMMPVLGFWFAPCAARGSAGFPPAQANK
jgi:hypothetical protein